MSVVKFMKPTTTDQERLEELWEQEEFLKEAVQQAMKNLQRCRDKQIELYLKAMGHV